MEVLAIIIAVLAIPFTFRGIIKYNSLIEKWGGIIGVFKSYMIATGFLAGIVAIGYIISFIAGKVRFDFLSFIVYIAFAALGFFLFKGAARCCSTTGQCISLFFAAFSIALGFAFRLVFNIFFGLAMSSAGGSENGFPAGITMNGEYYSLVNDFGWGAEYTTGPGGKTITIRKADLQNIPPQNMHSGVDS